MQDVTLILLGAGRSSRFKLPVKKQWLWSGDAPVWLNLVSSFEKIYNFKKIVIVSSEIDILAMSKFSNHQL